MTAKHTPRQIPNPIELALRKRTPAELAVLLGYTSTESIYKLRKFVFLPTPERAQKLAELLGGRWTAGRVIDACIAASKVAA